MTMPQMMNCSHKGDGWCLDCVGRLYNDKARLKEVVEFYAAEMYYGPPDGPIDEPAVHHDRGSRARAVLKLLGEEFMERIHQGMRREIEHLLDG